MSKQSTNPQTRTDLLLLVAFCGFLFFYGLGAFGLIGADEPRYAQVAREMLERSDWVTPTLLGKPWLEKPVLYYWQAMLSFRAYGITDQAARLPAAFDAAMLIAAIYFFLRRFRPGSELDGVFITASCAAVVSLRMPPRWICRSPPALPSRCLPGTPGTKASGALILPSVICFWRLEL